MKKRPDGRYRISRIINGKTVYFYSYEENERRRQKDFESQLANYKEKEAQGKLFSEVADEWEKEHSKTVSYSTTRRYEPLVRYAEEFFDGEYIKEIDPNDVDAYLQTYIESPLKGSKKTATMALSVLNMIFVWGIRHRYCRENPCTYIQVPKDLPKTHRSLPSESDIKKVEEYTDTFMGLFAYFLIYTGLRRSEAMALTWKDIDFAQNRIHVTKSCYKDYGKGVMVVKAPKTEAGTREVVLLKCLKEKLLPYRKSCNSIYVFPDAEGNILTDGKLEKMWKNFKNISGITFTPHQARHLFATVLHEADIDEKTAQKLMGHASIVTTKDIYTHLRNRMLDKTEEKLNAFLEQTP